MADEVVRTGTNDDDGTGDTLRQAFALINHQFGVTRSLLSSRGTWTTGTAYKATPHREWVIQGGTAYVCAVDHTAGTFATDLAAGKWISADAVQLGADLASTASGRGPEMIGFMAEGAGAVARTAASKMREIVSVLDFMTPDQIADVKAGTESMDVTAAIQAALNSVRQDTAAFDLQIESRGGTVRLPAGRYLVSAALVMRPGTCLIGDGPNVSVIVNAGTNNHVLTVTDTQGGSVDPIGVENLAVVQKFGVSHTAGNAINMDGNGFGISPIIRNVRTQDTYGGLYFDWCFPVTVENVHAMRHTVYGFKTRFNCTSMTFQNCYPGAITAGSGFAIAGHYISMINCASDSNALDGYEVYYDGGAATGISLISCGAEACGRDGISADRVAALALVSPRIIMGAAAQSCLQFDGGDAITVISPVMSGLAANANPCINIQNTSGAYPSNVQLLGYSGNPTNYAALTNQPDYLFFPGNRANIGMYNGTFRLGGIGAYNNQLQIYHLGSNFPAGVGGISYGENIVPVATAAFALAAASRYKPVVNAPALTLARLIAGAFVDTPTITAGTVTRAEGQRINNITGGTANANLVLGDDAIPATQNYSICNTSTRENLMRGPIRWSSSTGPVSTFGAGTPEGVLALPVGSTYQRTDGGAGASFYVKESGTGTTGWVAK